MGNWQLEVFRMVMYMAFPVAMFHYFNQPHIYEDWMVKKKRELFPLINRAEEEKLKETIREIRNRQEAKAIEEMEANLNK